MKQSVFNHLPTIVNATNIKSVANNYNDVSIGENVKVEIAKKPAADTTKKFTDNYKPAD